MKTPSITWLLAFIIVLTVAPSAAQIDNSCAYKYSFGKADASYFRFCLTKYGTLASLQSLQGVEHINQVNPVEGWIISNYNEFAPIFDQINLVPGFGAQWMSPESIEVYEPKGVGKLPIIFDYKVEVTSEQGSTAHITETVTAVPSEKMIVFTMKTPTLWNEEKQYYASGPFVRLANPEVDGLTSNSFDTSSTTAFAYNRNGHGVMLNGMFTGAGLYYPRSTTEGWAGVGPASNSGPNCDDQFFTGQGQICAGVQYMTAHPGTAVFTYKLF